jgi:hypothetical protein
MAEKEELEPTSTQITKFYQFSHFGKKDFATAASNVSATYSAGKDVKSSKTLEVTNGSWNIKVNDFYYPMVKEAIEVYEKLLKELTLEEKEP